MLQMLHTICRMRGCISVSSMTSGVSGTSLASKLCREYNVKHGIIQGEYDDRSRESVIFIIIDHNLLRAKCLLEKWVIVYPKRY